MKAIVWIMISVFALGGLWCLRHGLASLFLALRRRPYLRRVMGTILVVEKNREVRMANAKSDHRSSIVVKFTPIIHFATPEGESITFRSETGESYPVVRRWNGQTVEPVSRFTAGQRIPVVYDPSGELTPREDSWSGIYGMATAMLIAGFLFSGASTGMIMVYRDHLFAKSGTETAAASVKKAGEPAISVSKAIGNAPSTVLR